MITVTGVQQEMAAEKRSKDRAARDAGDAEPLTAAHAIAEGEAAEAAREARKAITGLEADPGPGTFTEPGRPGAEQFDRPYLDTGHSAPSPQHRAPNVAPVPPGHPGVLTPLQMSAVPAVAGTGPVVRGLAQHQARAVQSMPPVRGQ